MQQTLLFYAFVSHSSSARNNTTSSWTKYIATLLPWESDLLQHVHISTAPDAQITLMNTQASILGDSDGSVQNSNATFGWVLSTLNGRTVAKGFGAAHGIPMSSFRAEGYGFLAMLQFLFHLSKYTNTPFQPILHCWLDNQALVTRITKRRTQSFDHPNATLIPDWDVTNAIVQTLSFFPSIIIKWIKGHQDKLQPSHSLPIEAHLNCQADAKIFDLAPLLSG